MIERCIDASIALKVVLKGEPHRVTARRLLHDSTLAKIGLIAPPFFPYEVDSVVRKQVYSGKWTLQQAQKAYAMLDATKIQVVDHPNLRERTRQLAEQFNQPSVYDISYAALADLRGCEFWTADKPFYDSVKGTLTFVKYLPDYP